MPLTRQRAMQELGGALLASVSRSFYLSIKLLPGKVREPVALAYLLARTADTVADTAEVPAEVRLKHLDAFRSMVHNGVDLEKMLRLQHEILPPDAAERELLEKMEPCLDWLAMQTDADRADIAGVLENIIHGQRLDILRFSGMGCTQALQTSAELNEYTFLVAGCVGEFWTRVCCRHLEDYSQMETGELCALGVRLGKGLQLVNILRDMPADLRAGRCYLPADELKCVGVEPGAVLQSADAARPVFDHWWVRAAAHFNAGFEYIEAVSRWRVRLACILPWAIGMQTLALLQQKYPLTAGERVKVPRSDVYRLMFHGVMGATSNDVLYFMRVHLEKSLAEAKSQAPGFGKK